MKKQHLCFLFGPGVQNAIATGKKNPPFLYNLLFGFITFTFASSALLAREDGAIERASATAFAAVDYGMTTHKSEFVDSNDTGNTLGYSLGFHAGSERSVGILIKSDTSSLKFELNGSEMKSSNQDVVIRYRLGNVFFGAVITSAALEAVRAEETTDSEIDAVGTGFGAHFATVWGIGRTGSWFLDGGYNSYSQTREANQIDMTFNSRMDVDSGVTFYLTREVIDLTFGYRYRMAGYSAGDSAFTDTITSTYLGLRFNAMF